ncbi:MFS transporter [Spongiactinospora sp. TRM90649]|uniref:MFS transporter n=1 Tax=Spongiactinospora sp. TRM90649 TaxID=3031114 RepID=UPI0023F76500|nr:MFS transporter [Spongiactinospora sp. TRM90649]MDF5755247.1 MFS transporter [Spongiactinospora sp. TRM90649]
MARNASADVAGATDSEERPGKPQWLGFVALLLGMFIVQVDFFIVNVALPHIQRDLSATLSEIQLVAISYGGAVGLTVITGGRLGDSFGRRRLFLIGIVGISVASLLCGLAWSAQVLVAARVLQGLAAGLIMPQGIGSLHAMFTGPGRERAFSVFGVVMGLSWGSGMVFGGLLLAADVAGMGWRSIFLISIPLAAAAFLLGRRWLVESHAPSGRRLDIAGVFTLAMLVATVLFPLTYGRQLNWPPWVLAMLGLAALLGILLVKVERQATRRGHAPVLPPELFRDRNFVTGVIVIMVFFLGPPGYFLLITLYLQSVCGFSPFESGLSLLPFSSLFLITSYFVKPLKERMGEWVIVLGAAIMIVGIIGVALTIAATGQDVTVLALVPATALLGIGQALVTTPLYEMLLRNVRNDISATASGVFTTLQLIAQQVGVAIAIIIFTGIVHQQIEATHRSDVADLRQRLVVSGIPASEIQELTADLESCVRKNQDALMNGTHVDCAGGAEVEKVVRRTIAGAARQSFSLTLLFNLAMSVLTGSIMAGYAIARRRRN